MNLAEFKKQPILGIVRGVEDEQIEPLVEAVISAGLRTLEITMNTKGAARLISKAKKSPKIAWCWGQEPSWMCRA